MIDTKPIEGVVAILRGVAPDEVLGVAEALIEGGIALIEVPLNSPRPFDSIQRLARTLCATCKKRTIVPAQVLRESGFNVTLDVEAYEPVGCGRCGPGTDQPNAAGARFEPHGRAAHHTR